MDPRSSQGLPEPPKTAGPCPGPGSGAASFQGWSVCLAGAPTWRKIDQYLKQDLEWRGNKPDHELQKLYGSTPHVYYALVCRTALGAAAITKDGNTSPGPQDSRGLQGLQEHPKCSEGLLSASRAGASKGRPPPQAVRPEDSRALLHSGPSAYTNEKVLLLTKMD